MRPSFLRSSLMVGFLSLAACDSCDKKPTPTADDASSSPPPSKDAAVATTPEASAPDPATAAGDAGAKHDMGNCPTAIPGVTVALKDVEGGIEVSVTGTGEATTKDIRDRMKKIAEADKNDAGGGAKHDHSGSGGGTTGRCTIIMRNTKLVTAEIPNGAKVTVTPKDKSELDWLRRETKERDKDAKAAGAAGAGAQRMAHCPSAIDGAKTAVKDAKDGAVITVTGPADKVAEIRTRAKHASEVAKKVPSKNEKEGDGGKVDHTGGGTGGGGLGKCPIVVEGDTTVDVKEVEGGVEVTVKTRGDAAALQKEVKLRAANFAK